jgi:hypothetical protein
VTLQSLEAALLLLGELPQAMGARHPSHSTAANRPTRNLFRTKGCPQAAGGWLANKVKLSKGMAQKP